MTRELPPYPAYVDSGVEWLGPVPAHWKVLPARALFTEVNNRNHPEEEMLSVTISRGIIRQRSLLEERSKKDSSRLDRSAYKLVEIGDIAYNKMRAWQGAVGLSTLRGIVSPAYIVQRPRQGSDPRFLEYLLRTPAFAKEAESWSYGIASDMWSLRPEHFRLIRMCLPPADEQSAVVRFLQYLDHQVNRFIRNRRRLIEVLNEQKSATIQQAVTRGLDPSVPLKPSGVEWIGYVPVHWDVEPLRRIGPMFKGRGGTKLDNTDAGVPCVRYGDLYTKYSLLIEKVETFVSEERSVAYVPIVKGDILFAGSGETLEEIGKSAVYLLEEPAVCGGDVIVLRPTRAMNPEYLGYAAGAEPSQRQKSEMGRGFTVVHIYGSELKHLAIPVPPLSEQAEIAAAVREAVGLTDAAILRAKREIELAREYRTRLIADVVTGKVDIRGLAAELEAEPDDMDESLDAGELLDDEALDEGEGEMEGETDANHEDD